MYYQTFSTIVLLCFYTIAYTQSEYSLQFDGVNDYVDCGTPSGYNFNDLTLLCWVKTTASPGTYQGVISKDCGCSDFSLLLHVESAGDVSFEGDDLGMVTGGDINDGNWHFIAGTRDGDSGKLKLYIDGILIDSAIGGTGMITNNEQFQLGRYTAGNPHYYQGQLDEVSIWDAELTMTQIQYYMSHCPPPNVAGLKGFWSFDEGVGGTVYDATNNNNDGTLINGVQWSTATPATCILPDVRVLNADLYIHSGDKGIVLKSPDGSCWRVKVSNTGSISTESIPCPD